MFFSGENERAVDEETKEELAEKIRHLQKLLTGTDDFINQVSLSIMEKNIEKQIIKNIF
jgi:hypothetical protein